MQIRFTKCAGKQNWMECLRLERIAAPKPSAKLKIYEVSIFITGLAAYHTSITANY
jgi:hypothetical protein